MSVVESAISQVPGIVGVAARHLEAGKELRHNAGEVFFTASTKKIPILVELYRQADEGRVSLDERIELTESLRVPGSGVLKELAPGLQPTLHDLALLMIIISDNVATDTLYHMVGRERLDETMRGLGLTKTRIPMGSRDLLYSITGVDEDDPQGLALVSERLARREVVPDSDALSEERSSVSSPEDMVRLLEMVYRSEVLSQSSREAVLDILERQQLSTIIPYFLPPGTRVAHKTGGVPSVRCDVGIVYSPSGPYAVALMVKRVTDMLAIDQSLARVSRAIYDEFNG